MLVAGLLMAAGSANVQAAPRPASAAFKPTIDDWVGVNAAVDNYTLGLELHDMAVFDKAFWPEAMIIAKPEPGLSFARPYRDEAGPPKAPPPGLHLPPGAAAPGMNAAGTANPPWHLALNHHFEFQSAARATHYGYFVSVYPDLATKKSVVGLPGHYEDVLEKRHGEWRILQRTTVIGVK